MSRVRIVEKGWTNFTGYFGITLFDNGLSVDEVHENELSRLGALVHVERMENGEQAGASVIDLRAQNISTDDLNAMVLQENSIEKDNKPVPVYTQKELENIADTRGIVALREIGEKLDARGKSIIELIKAILKKQGVQYADTGYYVK